MKIGTQNWIVLLIHIPEIFQNQWARSHKISENYKTYDNISVTKVVLLFTYWKKKIIFRDLQLIFDTKNWVWKSKNALFWRVAAPSFCQIWKNLLVSMIVDLKDYISNFECLPLKIFLLNYYKNHHLIGILLFTLD